MNKDPLRSFDEIRSPMQRRILRILNSPVFSVPFGILYLLILLPIGFILRINVEPFRPDRLSRRAYQRASGLTSHSAEWNKGRLETAQENATASEKRRWWLAGNLPRPSDLLNEKERIVAQIVAELQTGGEWLRAEDEVQRAQNCADVLDHLPPAIRIDALALATEALRRTLDGVELHGVQVQAAFTMTDRYFIELRNGEGKTFVSVPVLVWAALRLQAVRLFCRQKGVPAPFVTCFAFTANDYLVRRDFVWLKAVYELLGIAVAFVQTNQHSAHLRKLAYTADIVFMAGSDFGFDYLRNSCRDLGKVAIQQQPYFALVDEADQLLLDESNTPLILSGESSVRSEAFVESAWVRQIDLWVENIFRENRLFHDESDAGFSLTMAGHIYLRTLLAESKVTDWRSARESVLRGSLYIPLSLLVQIILHTPVFRRQLSPAVAAYFESIVNFAGGELLRRDASSGRLLLTKQGALQSRDISMLQFRDLNPRNITLVTRYLLQQIRLAVLSEEDKAFLRGTRRRIPRIVRRLLFVGSFVGEAIEHLANEIAARAEQAPLPEAFLNGLCHFAPNFDSTRDTQLLSEWAVSHLVPGLANLAGPALREIAASTKPGIHGDLHVLLRFYLICSRIPHTTLSGNPDIRNMVQEFAVVGALLQNFLFVPDSGTLTAAGRSVAEFLEAHCARRGLTDERGRGWVISLIERSLHAYYGLTEDRDYIVHDGRITLVNQITGRQEPGKHFGRSIHPFVQAKHDLRIEESLPTKRTITVQNVMRRFPRVVGMSGTLISHEGELRQLYSPKSANEPIVVAIPPRVEPKLKREECIVVGRKAAKWELIAQEVLNQAQQSQQPVLVITASVEDSNQLATTLRRLATEGGISLNFELLNARWEEKEEEVVSWAGQPGAVTIATQMVARGTDIVIPHESVKLGGLYVIVAEFHQSARLDSQAEGRAARQGDPGRSRFFVSLEDKLLQYGISTSVAGFIEKLFQQDFSTFSPDGLMVRNLRGIQENIQLYNQRWRAISAQVDDAVDPYRRDGDRLREYFVTAATDEMMQGFENLLRIYLARLGCDEHLLTISHLAQEISDEIQKSQLGADDLVRQFGPRISLTLTPALFEPILTLYSRQRTPYLEVRADKEPVRLQELIRDALVTAARNEDLRTLNRNWPQLSKEYELQTTIKPPQFKKLLERLNRSLSLGFDSATQRRALQRLAELVRRGDPNRRGGYSEYVRKALVEEISSRDPWLADNTAIGKGDVDPLEQRSVLGIPVDEKRPDQVLQELRGLLLSLFANDRARREAFCQSFLETFDELWEKALDDTYLVEMRVRREDLDAWTTFLQEVNKLYSGFFEDLAVRCCELIGRSRESQRFAPLVRTTRWLPIGASGPAWFQHSNQEADDPLEAEMADVTVPSHDDESHSQAAGLNAEQNEQDNVDPKGSATTSKEISSPVASDDPLNNNDVDVDDTVIDNHVDDAQSELASAAATSDDFEPSDQPETSQPDWHFPRSLPGLSTTWGDFLRFWRRRPEEPIPDTDALLSGELQEREHAYWLRCCESLISKGDYVGASACLDNVRFDPSAFRARSRIFEALGCRKSELEYLRRLQNKGALEIRLKLRLASVLTKGNLAERREGVNLLVLDTVPMQSESGAAGDTQAVEALAAASRQLLDLHEYSSAVELFLSRPLLIAGPASRSLDVLEILSESLAKCSDQDRTRFHSMIGSDWREWITEKVQRHRLTEPNFWRSGASERALLRICLFAENLEQVVAMLRRALLDPPSAWTYHWLSEIFGSCGYEFEKTFFEARMHLLNEDFEEADEQTAILLKTSADEETIAMRIYSLLGLARCLQHNLYGRDMAQRALRETLEHLSSYRDPRSEEWITELMAETLCRLQLWPDAEATVQHLAPGKSSWRVVARFKSQVGPLAEPDALVSCLQEIQPIGETEIVECCRLCNEWFEELRIRHNNHWNSRPVGELLVSLDRSWVGALQDSQHYRAWRQLGTSARLMADWFLDSGLKSEAAAALRQAIECWNRGIPLTHDPAPPYNSVLQRHERSLREEMEVEMRRCQRRIKQLEETSE